MGLQLAGKVVVVTGSSKRIGGAGAGALAGADGHTGEILPMDGGANSVI